MNWPFALFNSVVCGLVSLPKTLPHPSSSPPVCFYKQLLCCEAPLGDPGGHGGPPRSPGRLGSSAGRVLFVAVFPMFVFSVCSDVVFPVPPPADCATGTLSRICSHRKAHCTLHKHFYFEMKTGYTRAHCDWFHVSVYMV